MPYPARLPVHPRRETFAHGDCFDHGRPFYDLRAYRHDVYPLLGMHDHTFHEINIILKGEGRHYIGERSCPAQPGTVFVLPPHIPHGYAANGELMVYHILISAAYMQRYRQQLQALEGYTLFFEVEPLLRGEYDQNLFLRLEPPALAALTPLLEQLAALCDEETVNSRILCHGLFLQIAAILCTEAAGSIPGRVQGAAADLPILRSMEHIHAHCDESLEPRALAQQAGMSYATYLRHFTRVSGQTPHAYQTDCRIRKARQLLRHTDMTVLQVALECGFYDSAHFIRTFRRHVGVSPAVYAQQEKAHPHG